MCVVLNNINFSPLKDTGTITLAFLFVSHIPHEEASYGYQIFNNREDDCIKVILKP